MKTQLTKYNSKLVLLIVFFLSSTIFPQQGWYNMNLSFGGEGIHFKDLNTGIISGYKTTNGGFTWNYTGFGGPMSFPGTSIGYATGGGLIFKTTNFGDNWIIQNNPTPENLSSIHFPDVNTGFACGGGGTLIKTTNGGNNWFIVEPINQSLKFAFYFSSVFFTDVQTGYIAGSKYAGDTSVFIKTTDGGVNWNVQRFTISNWGIFTSMFFINSSTGFIGSATHAYVLKTINGGANWNQVMIPTTNSIYSMFFPSASTGYASCFGGQILKSTNNGNNWFLQTTGTGSVLYSIFFINDLTGYCSGDNNTVLKTTDGGGPPIGITPISNEVPVDYMLKQNYPNPFNPTTNIEFSLPRSSFVRLVVFDMLGREVETLVNENLSASTFKADWNASNYPSGIYFYRLEVRQAGSSTNGFVESRKMILIK
ncbi:MAG: T9SS type A sorting domain-containing protein [Ignavibacteria bacterium]|nr:T9SS type A sorting domain-containing protein [Ignavibacteria bacterium]